MTHVAEAHLQHHLGVVAAAENRRKVQRLRAVVAVLELQPVAREQVADGRFLGLRGSHKRRIALSSAACRWLLRLLWPGQAYAHARPRRLAGAGRQHEAPGGEDAHCVRLSQCRTRRSGGGRVRECVWGWRRSMDWTCALEGSGGVADGVAFGASTSPSADRLNRLGFGLTGARSRATHPGDVLAALAIPAGLLACLAL